MSTSSSRRCSQFSIQEIKAATNRFNSKILGRGGEATVYLAEIFIDSKKTPVAVKRLKQSSNEFEREIQTFSKIQHPYLVSLLGYCNESGHKILVYEYMAKGCLSDYVTMGSPISLSWLQRLTICHGAALGLQHLHKETDELPFGIIHRDVKPGNILVGENWIGKVSDFGMFKLSSVGQDKSVMSTNVKGTFGYYAPEYVKYNRVTRKIDVYAFGVVLFQVLCRKMPWDRGDESYYGKDDDDLGLWAQENVDTQIKREISGDSLRLFTGIISISLQADPDKRPTMDHVVLHLEKALECQYSKIQAERPTATVFLPRFSQFLIEEIRESTNQFDSSKIISHGGETILYHADIQIGQNKLGSILIDDDGGEEEKEDGEETEEEKADVIICRKNTPPGGDSTFVLYTDDQKSARDCNRLRNILESSHMYPFDERSINKPKFRKELEGLVNSVSCPRLFVRGLDIGGIDNVVKLLECGLFTPILHRDELMDNEGDEVRFDVSISDHRE